MFNKKLKDRIKELEQENLELKSRDPTPEQLMEYFGIPILEFANVDEEGRPPHYLSGLTEDERKNFLTEMESIYTNDKFQKVVAYTINLVGNHSIQKSSEEKMPNGRYAIVGLRMLNMEFENAHAEFLESRKPPDPLDKFEVISN